MSKFIYSFIYYEGRVPGNILLPTNASEYKQKYDIIMSSEKDREYLQWVIQQR